MTPETQAALASLRELHLPTGGGGVLQGEILAAIALGFVTALLVGAIRLVRARMRDTIRQAAMHELAIANVREPGERRVAQARLLRRVVRTLSGDADSAARGADWAAVLDRTFATRFFSEGAGNTLVEGMYRRPSESDTATIDAELGGLFSRIKG